MLKYKKCKDSCLLIFIDYRGEHLLISERTTAMFKKEAITFLFLFILLFSVACNSTTEKIAPSQEEVTGVATVIINHLVAEEYSEVTTYFCPIMKKELPEEKLKSGWVNTLNSMGSYIGEVERSFYQQEDYMAVNILSEFEEGLLVIRVVFDSEKRVAGLWLQEVEK